MMSLLKTLQDRAFILKLIFISMGIIVGFALGYVLANIKTPAADLHVVETILQESTLPLPEDILTLEPSRSLDPTPFLEPPIDATILEQIFREVVGEEIDLNELGYIIGLDENSVLAIGYREAEKDRTFAIFNNADPWLTSEEAWYLLAITSWGRWDFTPHITRSWHGRRDLENESAIMKIYPLFDWGGYPKEEWDDVAKYVEVELSRDNFPEQLIPLLRQHIAWHDWEGNRREVSIRDMWFIENRLFIDFDDISIWDNMGSSGEHAIAMSLYRSLASLMGTEDVEQVVFLYNGAENFYVGGHGGKMGRLNLNREDTLRWLGLILDEETNYDN